MTDKTMRAVAIEGAGGPGVLTLRTLDRPALQPGEVMIKVHAAGVNRPDVMQRKGLYPPPPGASPLPGLEVAGEICDKAADCPNWSIGDRVVALTPGGGYAEYVAVPHQQVLPWPSALSAAQAAGVPETFFTVWSNLFQRAYAAEGDSVLVHGGSSGIGSTAILLGKAFGLTVYTTAGSEEKCQFSRDLGADAAINYKTEIFEDRIKELTDGKGVDVVLDMIGGDYLMRNVACMKTNGRHVTIAFQNGPKTDINLAPILIKRLTLTGSTLRPRSIAFKGAVAAELLEHVWPLLEDGSLAPVVDSVFSLEDAAKAHQLIDSSKHMGKIILEMV